MITSWAKMSRRAAGRLRPGGKRPPRGSLLGGGLKHGITPDQADQGEVPVQPGPAPPLVVPEPQFLLTVFMEALYAPAPMRQPQLVPERAPIQVPGEVPFRVPGCPRQGAFPEQPAWGPVAAP